MKIIAHRGNIKGPNPSGENHPSTIMEALTLGFDVEVDVWCFQGSVKKNQPQQPLWYLGHDCATYVVDEEFLNRSSLWLHCKNLEALKVLNSPVYSGITKANYFWHENDQAVLVKNKSDNSSLIWNNLNVVPFHGSVCVLPEMLKTEFTTAYGKKIPTGDITKSSAICTDFAIEYDNYFN